MKKSLGCIEKEIIAITGLKKILSNTKDRYILDTDYGVYRFYFDNEGLPSIFGRFDALDPSKLPPREIGGMELPNYPNIYSGKMNFHGPYIENFVGRMEMINAVAYQYETPILELDENLAKASTLLPSCYKEEKLLLENCEASAEIINCHRI